MGQFHYKAFISYAHTDKVWASWLHKSLETYSAPKALRKSDRGKLKPIFRDTADFASGHDLSEQIQLALADSQYLILLCSPASAASHWVNEEIRQFKALRGDKHILCVMVDGNPATAFPPALTENGALEPLAADPRVNADGKRLCRLKIAAGLMGVGLDELVQRDLRRRHRRVTAITASSLIAMLAMGTMTFTAMQARKEATLRKADAEGLIEYMLTDLRDKLEPVGRLDVLDSVGERALAYYDAQDINDMSDNSVGRRARAFHLIGEIDMKQGERSKARTQFENAAQATQQLLARNPNDTARMFDHSQSLYWTGYAKYKAKDLAGAQRDWQSYDDLAARLQKLEPDNTQWTLERGYSLTNLGVVHRYQKNFPEALKAYKESLKLKTVDLASTDSKRLFSAATTLGWIVRLETEAGTLNAALDYSNRERAIYFQLIRQHPKDMARLRFLGISGRRHAALLYNLGRASEALDMALETEIHTARLAAHDPDNIAYQALHINQVSQVESLAIKMNDDVTALRTAESLDAFIKALPEKIRETTSWNDGIYPRLMLHHIRFRMDGFSTEQKLRALQNAQAELRQILPAQEGSSLESTKGRLVEATLREYLLRHEMTDNEGAIEALDMALSIMPLEETYKISLLILRLECHIKASQPNQAQAIITTLKARGVNTSDFLTLIQKGDIYE